MKPPLREEEEEEVTQEKRTARSPSQLSESPSPRGEGGRGPPAAAEEKEEEAPAAAAAPSAHLVARHSWAWDAPRVSLVPGLSVAGACCFRVPWF